MIAVMIVGAVVAPIVAIIGVLFADDGASPLNKILTVTAWIAVIAWGGAALRWRRRALQHPTIADIHVVVPPEAASHLDEREIANRVTDLLRRGPPA